MRLVRPLIFAGVLMTFHAAAGQNETKDAKATVQGQVVDAVSNAPVKKALVRWGHAGSGRGLNLGPVETDAEGHFLLPDLDAGAYDIGAERAGYLKPAQMASPSTFVTVHGHENVTGVWVKLTPQAVISGKVTDEDREPVRGVSIKVYRYGYVRGRRVWLPVAAAKTSDTGEYRVAELPPASYVIAAAYPSPNRIVAGANGEKAVEMGYPITYYPNSPDASSAGRVSAAPGDNVSNIDLQLRRVPVFRVRGKVIGPDIGEHDNIRVVVTTADSLMDIPLSSALTTGPDHTFELPGVAPGSYSIGALAMLAGGGRAVGLEPLEVGSSDVDHVAVPVAAPGGIDGVVQLSEPGATVDFTGVRVRLSPIGAAFDLPEIRADRSGKLHFPSVPPYRYDVDVTRTPENCYVSGIYYASRPVPDDGIIATPGAALRIDLAASAGTLDGIAVDSNSNVVPGTFLLLIPKQLPRTYMKVATADQNGAFRLTSIRPGEYLLYCWQQSPGDTYQDPDLLESLKSAATSVTISPEDHQSISVHTIRAGK